MDTSSCKNCFSVERHGSWKPSGSMTVDGRWARWAVNPDGQTTALRMRFYMDCSECARLLDLLDGRKPQRVVELEEMVRHDEEDHDSWLELLDI